MCKYVYSHVYKCFFIVTGNMVLGNAKFFSVIFSRRVFSEKTVEKILDLIKGNKEITQKELEKLTGLTRRGIEWNISQLKDRGIIRRIGADKGGYWEILK